MRWRIRLQVRYRRRADLVVALLAFTVLLMGGLALGQRLATAETANAVEAVERGFYLSLATFQGDQARLACAPGYHFASLWEILDTSRLRYNTSLGKTAPDSGEGPPAAPAIGWVLTGYSADAAGEAGNANCDAWTSGSSGSLGTFVRLPNSWIYDLEDLLGWEVALGICSSKLSVWCVEGGTVVYLPLILRSYSG